MCNVNCMCMCGVSENFCVMYVCRYVTHKLHIFVIKPGEHLVFSAYKCFLIQHLNGYW